MGYILIKERYMGYILIKERYMDLILTATQETLRYETVRRISCRLLPVQRKTMHSTLALRLFI